MYLQKNSDCQYYKYIGFRSLCWEQSFVSSADKYKRGISPHCTYFVTGVYDIGYFYPVVTMQQPHGADSIYYSMADVCEQHRSYFYFKEGINVEKAYKLPQISVRLKLSEEQPLYSTESLDGPEQVVRVMAEFLREMDREYCCVLNLDNKLHPINFNVVSIGDINGVCVPIQNVFKAAILSNAKSIILFHNHPSGSLTPGKKDMDVTKKLIEAGKIMDIPLIDHIIVGGGNAGWYSLKNNTPLMFSGVTK